jgi:hypothetical protein
MKSSIWNEKEELLEKFTSKNIIKGMQKAENRKQYYINNSTVNDYTSFSIAYMEYRGKYYSIYVYYENGKMSKIQLQYNKDIKNIA